MAGRALASEKAQAAELDAIAATGAEELGDRGGRAAPLPAIACAGRTLPVPRCPHSVSMEYGCIIGDPTSAQDSDQSDPDCGHGEPDARQRARPVRGAGRGNGLIERSVPRLASTLHLPTLPGFGPALYELIAGRYERRPTLITSNKSLTEWAAIVQDASLAAALVDRILHHGEVFYLKGPSFRLKGRSPEVEVVAAAASASSNGTDGGLDAQHRAGGPEDAVR